MTAESALIPIPSEITMPFAGFLSAIGVFNFWIVVFVGALANLTGSLLAYWLGYVKGEEWTINAIKRWGKWLLIKKKNFDRTTKWFRNHGEFVAFTSRLVPVVRTFVSLPAGVSKMNIVTFSVYTFAGSFIWSAFLAYLGLSLGHNWAIVEPYFRRFQAIIIILFIIFAAIYILRHVKED
jgi:membrane protein DedA with SNARE-associated domain